MEYRRLGKSGLLVSELSFGSWVTFGSQIEDNTAENLMKISYDNGINFFDNAEVYAHGQSEIVMGKILKKMGWDRSTYVVSSKVFWGGSLPNQKGLMRKHIVEACHSALKRLQTDYLDLFFCHRPDRHTPIEETVWTMHNLIQQGKILYWGSSEWTAQQITEAHMVARQYNLIGPTMEQPQYNMFTRKKMERDYLPIFNNMGLGSTIWSPLASGVLTGKYLDKIPEGSRLSNENLSFLKEKYLDDKEKVKQIQQIKKIADKLEMSMANLALSWCLKNPNVSTVILGASKKSQLEENLKSSELVSKLDDPIMEEINTILANKPIIPEF
ncbi:MAG: aldo/keto reductase [Chitinophagales bacterium]|nr:aldo/keto reductase [Chitinophagales bacterium]